MFLYLAQIFLGEGSQPFSKGRERFRECRYYCIIAWQCNIFSQFSFSSAKFENCSFCQLYWWLPNVQSILLSPLFNRHFLGTNADNCFSPSKACNIFLRIGSPFLMTSTTHHGKKRSKMVPPIIHETYSKVLNWNFSVFRNAMFMLKGVIWH